MTNGQRVVLAYVVAYYLVPFLAETFIGDRLATSTVTAIYRIEPFGLYALALVSACAVGIWLAPRWRLFPWRLVPMRLVEAIGRLGSRYRRHRLAVACVLVVFAVAYVRAEYSAFRFFERPVSELRSPLLFGVMTLNALVILDFVYRAFIDDAIGPRTRRRAAEDLLMAASLVLSNSGTASMLVALVTCVFAVVPSAFVSILFGRTRASPFNEMRRGLLLACIGAALLVAAWVSGEITKVSRSDSAYAEKSGFTLAREVLSGTKAAESIEDYAYYVLSGISPAYYALTFTATAPREVLDHGASTPLEFLVRTAIFRADYLLGGFAHVERPPIGSLATLNYVLLSTEPVVSDRQGTSPGLLATFRYALEFPFDLLATAAYTVWLVRLIDTLVPIARGRLAVAGGLLLLVFLLFLFQSPLDLLLIDDSTAATLALIAVAIAPRRPVLPLDPAPNS